MSPDADLQRYAGLLQLLSAGAEPLPALKRATLLARIDRGESAEVVAKGSGSRHGLLQRWHGEIRVDGLAKWLDKDVPDLEKLKRSRSGIAQMLLGQLAEEHFEHLSVELLGSQGYRVEDQRVGRTDTDYRLLDPEGRPVCRLNIKFHGTLFRQALEYVGLDPVDCFALATYKIHGALQRQQEERVPYVFLIISVPDFPREIIEQNIQDDWPWLAARSNRATEEAIARYLAREPWAEEVKRRLRSSEFRVISARRAHRLLRDLLFDRVHAVRLRGFNRTFRGAEINMHLSLSKEMTSYEGFLALLADRGPMEVSVRLDRGEL